jgi:hypothetical protein
MGEWSDEVNENWSDGVLEYWSVGIRRIETHYSITPSLQFD